MPDRDPAGATGTRGVHWLKVPIVGMPGTECGHELLQGAPVTREVPDFKAEFGPCAEWGTWMVGMLFVCDKHAALVAADFGDDLEEIKAAMRKQYA